MFWKSNQKGGTMMETLAAISVVGMIGIGMLSVIGNVMSKFRQSVVVSQIQELQKNISDRYNVVGNYADLDASAHQKLIDDKVIPSLMVDGSGEIRHRLGGRVFIGKDSGVPENNLTGVFGSDDYYDVSFMELNYRTCVDILQINWIKNSGSNLMAISVNGAYLFLSPYGLSPDVSSATVFDLPVVLNDAMTACDQGDNNNITWVFQ